MERRLRVTVATIPPNLVRAAALLILLPLAGTGGYMLVEGWNFMDALYMTVITITTIGFHEVQPLDDEGRVFTMALAVAGVGTIFYALVSVAQFLLEGELATLLGVRRMRGKIESLRNHYILCGYGRVGTEIAHEFSERGIPFVIVESNPEAIAAAQAQGYPVVHGDATSDLVLREAGIERARGLLAASDSDSGNTFIVLTAKALRPDLYVVSRAGRPESEARMKRAGADRVFSPYVIAGRQMAISALQPLVAEFIDTLAPRREGAPVLAEIEVAPASALAGRTIADILHNSPSVVTLGLQKTSGELKVGPPGETILEPGDRLIVMGREDELEAMKPSGPARRRVRAPR